MLKMPHRTGLARGIVLFIFSVLFYTYKYNLMFSLTLSNRDYVQWRPIYKYYYKYSCVQQLRRMIGAHRNHDLSHSETPRWQ